MGGSETGWPHAVTLVLAAESRRQRRWTVDTAIEIVRKLAEQRKVVLADVHARTPSSILAALDVEEGEGIVDVLFRGASFSAVARRPRSESFFCLSAGSALPPLQVFYHHPRWQKIASRLPAADAHLLPCVSAEDWLEAGPIPGFEACIVLNGSGREIELPGGARRLAEFLAPAEIREEADLADVSMSADAAPPDTEALVAENHDVGVLTAEPVDKPRATLRLLSGPRRRSAIAAAGLIAALAFVVLLWRIVSGPEAPERSEPVAVIGMTEAAGPGALVSEAAAAGGRPQEVSLPYSVAIASYSSLDDALARQRELMRADLPVYVAPTPVRGVVYYRVFAGMLPEREQGEELMTDLVRRGIKDTVRAWDVRPARYAFNFGVYPSARDARAVVETLQGQGVPAYTVAAPAAAGGDETAYHVYAGGYEKSEDAQPLRRMIERAGLDTELVERVGWVPQ
ncbi:MAG: SPOR domain-containing protein [Gemmatimonadota bacterium]